MFQRQVSWLTDCGFPCSCPILTGQWGFLTPIGGPVQMLASPRGLPGLRQPEASLFSSIRAPAVERLERQTWGERILPLSIAELLDR